MSGIEFSPEACGVSGVSFMEDRCLGTWPDDFDPPAYSTRLETIMPFFIWAADEASAFCYRGRDWQGRIRRQLLATASYQVAHELWTGAQAIDDGEANHRSLISAAQTVTDGPTNEVDAFAQLDAGLRKLGKGARGMIHVTDQLLTKLEARQAIRFSGNTWLSATGNVVIADAGYTGDGPTTPADDPDPEVLRPAGDTQWAYATSWMSILLSDPVFWPVDQEGILRGIDRRLNDVRAWVGQSAAVVWNPCVLLAAEVDLPILAVEAL